MKWNDIKFDEEATKVYLMVAMQEVIVREQLRKLDRTEVLAADYLTPFEKGKLIGLAERQRRMDMYEKVKRILTNKRPTFVDKIKRKMKE